MINETVLPLYCEAEIENMKKMLFLLMREMEIVTTVVCKIVHKFASVWCKTALGEVGVSLP